MFKYICEAMQTVAICPVLSQYIAELQGLATPCEFCEQLKDELQNKFEARVSKKY